MKEGSFILLPRPCYGEQGQWDTFFTRTSQQIVLDKFLGQPKCQTEAELAYCELAHLRE